MVDDEPEDTQPAEWHAEAIPPLVGAFPGSRWNTDPCAGSLLEGCLPLVTPVVDDGKAYTCVMAHVEQDDDGWYTATLYAGTTTVPGAIPALDNPEGMDPSSPIRAVREALRRLRFPGVQATGDQLVRMLVAP